LANQARDAWWSTWSKQMANPSGSKVPLDPNQALTSRSGFKPTPRNSGGRRVPGPEAAQQKKL
jgi:hypothetical protein